MLFKNVAIAGLAHIDAPVTLTSDQINLELKPAMDRLGIKTDVLQDIAGIKARRMWDGDLQASDVATMAAEKALLDAGAVACAHAAEVAQQADVIFTMVPDTPDVEKVLFEQGKTNYKKYKDLAPHATKMPERDALERSRNFKEVNLGYSMADALAEADTALRASSALSTKGIRKL